MAEYISRSDVARTIAEFGERESFFWTEVIEALSKIPVPYGEDISDFQKYHCEFKCSVCGADIGVIEGGSLDGGGSKFRYCPNCGVKMKAD